MVIHLPRQSDASARGLDRLLSFPFPFPDETVPSVVGRFYFEYGYFDSPVSAVRFLFGTNPQSLNSVLPRGLARFISLLPESLALDLRAILSKHLLFPLAKHFLAPQRSQEIWQMLLSGRDVVPRLHGFGTHGHSAAAPPLMCWRCFEDDLREFGQAFWHRAHQIPGVRVCDHHGTLLLDGCSICGPFTRRVPQLCLPYLRCECGHDLREDEAVERRRRSDIDAAVKYATFARHVLEADLPDEFSERWVDFLRAELEQAGWAGHKGLYYEALTSKIISEISPSLLADLVLPGSARNSVEQRVRKWLTYALNRFAHPKWLAWHLAFLMNVFGDFPNLKSRWDEFRKGNGLPVSIRRSISANGSTLFPSELLARFSSPGSHVPKLMSEMPDVFRKIWNSGCIPPSPDNHRLAPWGKDQVVSKTSQTITTTLARGNQQDDATGTDIGREFATLDPLVQKKLLNLRRRVEDYRTRLLKAVSDDPRITRTLLKRQNSMACLYLKTLEPGWYAKLVEPLKFRPPHASRPIDLKK